MREILFRGKTSSGGWVYGGYVQSDEVICPKTSALRYYIDPSTVGQYTGLLDKNGVKIFEGDIVKFKAIKGYEAYGKILWNEKEATFYSIGKRKANKHFKTISYMINTVGIEVIGNVHDNPELLEENK